MGEFRASKSLLLGSDKYISKYIHRVVICK